MNFEYSFSKGYDANLLKVKKVEQAKEEKTEETRLVEKTSKEEIVTVRQIDQEALPIMATINRALIQGIKEPSEVKTDKVKEETTAIVKKEKIDSTQLSELEEIAESTSGNDKGVNINQAIQMVINHYLCQGLNLTNLLATLQAFASWYVEQHPNMTETALIETLMHFVQTSQHDLMYDPTFSHVNYHTYTTQVNSLGNYVTSDEFDNLKEYVRQTLDAAIHMGVRLKINLMDKPNGGSHVYILNMDTIDMLDTFLDNFKPTSANILKQFMTKLFNKLSNASFESNLGNAMPTITINTSDITYAANDQPIDTTGLSTSQLQMMNTVVDSLYSNFCVNQNQNAPEWKKLYFIGRKLEQKAVDYLRNHPDANATQLESYLMSIYGTSDLEKMLPAIANWNRLAMNYRDLNHVESAARSLLMAAINQGIQIRFNGNLLTNVSDVNNLLHSHFINGKVDLINSMINQVIANFSQTSLAQQLLNNHPTHDGEPVYVDTMDIVLEEQGGQTYIWVWNNH